MFRRRRWGKYSISFMRTKLDPRVCENYAVPFHQNGLQSLRTAYLIFIYVSYHSQVSFNLKHIHIRSELVL